MLSSTPTVHRSIARIHMCVAQHSYRGYLELLSVERATQRRLHDAHVKLHDDGEHKESDAVTRDDLRPVSRDVVRPTTATWDEVPDIGIGRIRKLSSVPSVVKHVTEENRKKNLQYVR